MVELLGFLPIIILHQQSSKVLTWRIRGKGKQKTKVIAAAAATTTTFILITDNLSQLSAICIIKHRSASSQATHITHIISLAITKSH